MKTLLKAFPLLLALFACPAAAQEHQWQAPNSEELIQHNKPIYKTEEKDVLDQINTDLQQIEDQTKQASEAYYERWGKCYGSKRYDWFGWKQATNGTWTTSVISCIPPTNFDEEIKSTETIAVTCKGLKIARLISFSYFKEGWSDWHDPGYGEKALVNKLCATYQ